jgi:hypothetical protein
VGGPRPGRAHRRRSGCRQVAPPPHHDGRGTRRRIPPPARTELRVRRVDPVRAAARSRTPVHRERLARDRGARPRAGRRRAHCSVPRAAPDPSRRGAERALRSGLGQAPALPRARPHDRRTGAAAAGVHRVRGCALERRRDARSRLPPRPERRIPTRDRRAHPSQRRGDAAPRAAHRGARARAAPHRAHGAYPHARRRARDARRDLPRRQPR